MLYEFSRTELLLGKEGLDRLKEATVTVLGVGGVGSHCIEALARSGVGHLVLVDHDTVSLTNINRQSIALHSTIGQYKTKVMEAKIADISPEISVTTYEEFVLEDNLKQVFAIRPDYIVGDFDSLPGEILEYYRQEGEIPIRTYNPVKDATDTKIALDKALEEGSTEIWILGATGTRIDHVVCNLQILKEAWEKKVPVWIVDSRNKIGLPVEKTFSLKKEEQYGTYVSLFPMGETVEGLTLKGFKYPLDHYQLKDREGLGVSNEITADVADVSWEQGVLLMIQSKD